MKFLPILSAVVLTSAVFGNPARSKIEDGDLGGTAVDKIINVPTSRCGGTEEIQDDKDCWAHCKSAKKNYFDGKCIGGLCFCRLNVTDVLSDALAILDGAAARAESGHRSVNCENLIRFGTGSASENHKGCGVHCRLLATEFKDGHCVEGVCYCTGEPTAKASSRRADEEESKSLGMTGPSRDGIDHDKLNKFKEFIQRAIEEEMKTKSASSLAEEYHFATKSEHRKPSEAKKSNPAHFISGHRESFGEEDHHHHHYVSKIPEKQVGTEAGHEFENLMPRLDEYFQKIKPSELPKEFFAEGPSSAALAKKTHSESSKLKPSVSIAEEHLKGLKSSVAIAEEEFKRLKPSAVLAEEHYRSSSSVSEERIKSAVKIAKEQFENLKPSFAIAEGHLKGLKWSVKTAEEEFKKLKPSVAKESFKQLRPSVMLAQEQFERLRPSIVVAEDHLKGFKSNLAVAEEEFSRLKSSRGPESRRVRSSVEVAEDHLKELKGAVVEAEHDLKNLKPSVLIAEELFKYLQGSKKKVVACENHGFCQDRCIRLKKDYTHGFCTDGVCRCQKVPTDSTSSFKALMGLIPEKRRPVVKCEHRRKSVSDGICKKHCGEFSADHESGICVDGVCQCGYAVFETEKDDGQHFLMTATRA